MTEQTTGKGVMLYCTKYSTIRYPYLYLHPFKYLAKRFRDHEPIADPRAKKLATCTNDDKRYLSAESPTSENAATGADGEDPPTKDLTRGTEDVDDGNVGRKDPRTKAEASVKGTSAKCTETTVALLESVPHETQNEPQDSPQVTPRLPIEAKPSECEWEVAASVVTAERTDGMVGMAKPRETDADVDEGTTLGREPAVEAYRVDEGTKTIADVEGKAALGGELAERVHRLDEGDEMEGDSESQPQQTTFYCEESRQRNENANGNVHTDCRSRGSG